MKFTGPMLKFSLVLFFALLYGCASSDTVKVNTIVPKYKIDDDTVLVDFAKESTLAAKSIDDWTKVENLFNITGNESPSTFVSRPAASPTQDAIAYTVMSGNKGSIFRQASTSRAKTSITDADGLNISPSFTPDGQYLIFSSNRSGEGQDLWRKRADGAGGITQVTTSTAFDFSPSVAADGETIVFQSHRVNNLAGSVWSVNMNGGLLTQLSAGESPKVSPDGRRIAFVKSDPKSGKQSIWLMQIDGSGQTELSSGEFDDVDPSWHPSGRYIVFASNAARDEKGKGNYDIWMMNADGTNRVQLTSNISRDDAPVFDQSGRRVVFRSNRGGYWNLYAFEPNLRASTGD